MTPEMINGSEIDDRVDSEVARVFILTTNLQLCLGCFHSIFDDKSDKLICKFNPKIDRVVDPFGTCCHEWKSQLK